jgi:DNA modification methylase
MELNKIYHNNCLDILKKMKMDSIDMCFTSPPYNCGNKRMYRSYNDDLPDDEYYKLLSDSLKEMLRICKGLIFFNINYMQNNKKSIYRLMYEFSDYLRENIIWDKLRAEPPIANILAKRYEYILLLTKNKDIEINNFKKNKAENYKNIFGNWISNLIRLSIKDDQVQYNKINRAGFPINLVRMFIDIYTKENDIILDPFMGLGTTAMACKQSNRNYIGIEIIKENIEIAEKRIKNECKLLF